MNRLLLKGGRVVCPATKRDGLFDILVDHTTILEIGPPGSLSTDGANAVDVHGCDVLPAAVDLGTFLRDPGREEEEPLDELLSLAARGGFGTLATLPLTSPRLRGSELVDRLTAQSRAHGAELAILGDLTDGDDLAELGEMSAAGACGFWAPVPRRTDTLLRHALEYSATFGKPAILSPSGFEPCPQTVLNETPLATRLGLACRPASDEVIATFRAIEIAHLAGAEVLIGPISSGRSLSLLNAAKRRGVRVHGFCTLLNLVFNESEYERRPYDTALRLDPPLGTAEDQQTLIQAVKDGELMVASGHRAVSARFKEVEMARAEPGAATLGSALAILCAEDLVGLTSAELVQAIAAGPAAALGLSDRGRLAPGARALITILDRGAQTRIEGMTLGRVRNHPLWGRSVSGAVRGLIADGRLHPPTMA